MTTLKSTKFARPLAELLVGSTVLKDVEKVVVTGKSVVLVRHHYAKTGDVEEIFNAYLEEKTGEK